MVDYYPVISRAVARLENNNYLTRGALYDRARAVLVAQLTKANSGVGEAQLQSERRALEHAILRTESEAVQTAIAATIQGARLKADDTDGDRAADALTGASAEPTVVNRSSEPPSKQATPPATTPQGGPRDAGRPAALAGGDADSKNSRYANTPAEIVNRSDAQKPTDAKAPAAKSIAPIPNAADWYLAKTPDGSVRQVVVSVPPSKTVASKFRIIRLEYDRFPMLASGTWCAGFFRLDGDPGPYLMLRVDDFIENVKEAPLAVALSFCKTSAGALFVISVRVDSEALGTALRDKFPKFPPLKYPVAEWIASLDAKYDVDLIDDALSRDRIHIVLAQNSGSSETVFSDSGQRKLRLPQAVCDIVVPFDPAIASCLRAEWNALLAQHNSIPNSNVSFSQAQRELARTLPFDKDPVLPRPAVPEKPERPREPPFLLRNTGVTTIETSALEQPASRAVTRYTGATSIETPAVQYSYEPRGIEGWLILPAIGLVVGPLVQVVLMAVTYLPLLSKLGQLEGSLANWIVIEFLASAAMLAAYLYVAYLFFNEKRKTPAWFIGLIAASLFINLADSAVGSGVFGFAADASGIFRSLFVCIVWIPYWLLSKRVKNTFVRD